MIRLEMGYPDFDSQVNILRDRQTVNPIDQIQEIIRGEEILCHAGRSPWNSCERYDTKLCHIPGHGKPERMRWSAWGVSPPGALAAVRMAKAFSYLNGRDYVMPEDVQQVFVDVCSHRMIMNPKARVSELTAADVLKQIMKRTKSPDSGR